MVISAITLKNLSQMVTVLDSAEIPYEVISLSLTTYRGNLKLVEPERQLFQIKVRSLTIFYRCRVWRPRFNNS